MTTSVMVGNVGGPTPGVGVYQQQLDENGQPVGELVPLTELATGQFHERLTLYTGIRLVIVETPQPASVQPGATPTEPEEGTANTAAA